MVKISLRLISSRRGERMISSLCSSSWGYTYGTDGCAKATGICGRASHPQAFSPPACKNSCAENQRRVGSAAEKVAERGGFEPPLAFTNHAFQACALNHSAISPPWELYSASRASLSQAFRRCQVFPSRMFDCRDVRGGEVC